MHKPADTVFRAPADPTRRAIFPAAGATGSMPSKTY
jgi:hypothetical protein